MKHQQIFLIGHPRCATTSLIHWLAKCDDIAVTYPKEVRYFDNNYDKHLSWYESHYPKDKRPIRVDGNPHYSYVGFAAERIAFEYPNAKIIQVVRDPFERAYSWWQIFHNMRPGREPRQFTELLNDEAGTFDPKRYDVERHYIPWLDQAGTTLLPCVLESGAYGSTRARYEKHFRKENILTIAFEDLVLNPFLVFQKVLSFIGSKTSVNGKFKFTTANIDDNWPAKNRRKVFTQPFTEEARRNLKINVNSFFSDELDDLSSLTGINYLEKYLGA